MILNTNDRVVRDVKAWEERDTRETKGLRGVSRKG